MTRVAWVWNDEQDAMLKDMWKDYSATQLAALFTKRFHRTMTKNSIIGRARRLRMPPKGPTYAQASSFHFVDKSVEKKKPHTNAVFVKYEPPKAEEKWKAFADTDPVPLVELTDHRCHFPVNSAWNEPARLFCGRDADPGCPYCKEHRAIAYNPIPPKSQRLGRLAQVTA